MKNNIKPLNRFFRNIIYSGVRDTHRSEIKRRIILFNLFSHVSVFFLLILASVAFLQKAHILGFVDVFIALVLLFLVWYLRTSGNQLFCSRIGAGLANLFFCYLFFTGGVNSTAFMWLYTYPILSFFLLGVRGGSLASLLLFLFALLFLAFDLSSPAVNVYTVDFAIRFLPSFLVVLFFSYLLEQSRAEAHGALVHMIEKLKKNEAQLESSRNRLEQRVADRTANLLEINKKLQVEIEIRKKAEKERRRLELELSNAQKMEMLGKLAGGVAHDLNNVLSGIVSYPDLLLMDLPVDDPLRNPLITIKKSGENAAAIVQDLLALARRGVIVKDRVCLNDVLMEYFQSPEYTKLRRENPGIQVRQQLFPDLQQLTGSSIHLQKVVMNLLINAFETIDKEGIITISTEDMTLTAPVDGYEIIPAGEYVILKIKDTGFGMTPDVLSRIFEPFYTRKQMGRSGTGLGMTVVWGTLKDHNGCIDIESTPGIGTTITLFFPVAPKAPVAQSSELSAHVHLKMGLGQTVLIVDDIVEQQKIGTAILEKLGYRVWSVSSGEAAVEFLCRQSVDLLLLDMIMGTGMDGLETYRKILETEPRQKAIIISGFSENDRAREALDLGINAYLQKPYTIEQMSLIVSEVFTD